MSKIIIVLNIRKPTKKELKWLWEIVAFSGSLVGIALGVRELILQYNMGYLFQPLYYFHNFLPIFAIFILLSCAVSGIYEMKKLHNSKD
jgi:thiol:disulfide interchange protein